MSATATFTDHSASPSAARLARARRATRMQFLALGVVAGTWGAHVASVKTRYGLSDATLSMALLAAAVGAVLSLFVAGRFVGRLGARRGAALAAFACCLMLAVVLELGSLVALVPAMFLFGATTSLFDVAINTEGSELESLGGRAIMSNLHGMFSVGGMLGAALAGLLLGAGVAPGLQLAAVAAGTAAVAALASRGMLDTHAIDAGSDRPAHFVWPRGALLVIGLLILAGMTAEGVMYDWCVLYLKQDLGVPQARAAIGYAAFAAAMALARFGGDALRSRYSERSVLRCSAALAAVAMAVVLLARHETVALVGFALVGAGLAPVAPILFNAATRVPGASRAAAIASVTSIGYSGLMIGPPLVGSIATASSLTAALVVVVLASALLAACARFVPEQAR